MEEVVSEQSPAPSRKFEIRQRIRALEEERSALENDIASLKERLEVIELERQSNTLSDEIGTLQIQKTLLEERYAFAENDGAVVPITEENGATVTTNDFEDVSQSQ